MIIFNEPSTKPGASQRTPSELECFHQALLLLCNPTSCLLHHLYRSHPPPHVTLPHLVSHLRDLVQSLDLTSH